MNEISLFLQIIRDFLNLCTISISVVSKVPQIKTVATNKSAVGISLFAVILEVFRYAVIFLYNYCNEARILSYLEHPVLLVQQSVLTYYVLKYSDLLTTEIVLMSILVYTTIAMFMLEMLPKAILTYMILSCPVLGASSRIIQLNQIFQSKRSDNISMTTWALSTFSSFARMCSLLIDSSDSLLLINSSTTFLLNLAVCLAALYYRNYPKQRTE